MKAITLAAVSRQLGNDMTGLGHSDAPVATASEDYLGLAPYAAALADFIAQCDTPMTVAIQGDWGTGKTSLMNIVREHLRAGDSNHSTETIWFATWQYAQFGATQALSISLLATLLRKMSGDDKSLLTSSMTVLKRLAKPALNVGIRLSTAGALGADDFGGANEDAVDLAANAEELKDDVAKLVKAKKDKGVERIVVFVDDLDRVPPARAVEILETIKLFVDLEGCVFVLALDYAVVRRGLKEKFGVAENDLGGRSFFDKIIQLPFSIPTARYETDRFISSLFGRMGLRMGADDGELFASLARASVSANPRGIKRVFNSLQLLIGMARTQGVLTGDEQSDRLMVRNLFALLCMQNRFESVHDWLVFNAHRLDASALHGLDGSLEGEASPDASLTNAIASLDEDQKQQFVQFSRAFVLAIQDPDGDRDEFDASELERFKLALTLTRVTSVKDEAGPILFNDPDFRWANRDLMKKLRDAYNAEYSAEIRPVAITQPHSESGVYFYRALDKVGWFTLSLYHGEQRTSLYLEASQRRLNDKKETIRSLLSNTAPLFDESAAGVITLWRGDFGSDLGIGERETLLTSQALPLFRSVERALAEQLE